MKQTYRNKVRKGSLYKSIDILLYKEFSKLEKQIQQYLDKTNLGLEVYWHKSNPTYLQHITNWVIEIDFDDYQWSYETMKPHHLYTGLSLEEVEDITNVSILRSRKRAKENNTLILTMNSIKLITLENLENDFFITKQLEDIKIWIKSIYDQFIKEIDTFNENDLEKYTNEEIVSMNKEMQDDETHFFNTFLESEKQGKSQENSFYRIALYYDEVLKNYEKAIVYYEKHLEFTFDERSTRRIKDLRK